MSDEVTNTTVAAPAKKRRGNPNFRKGGDNPYYKKDTNQMADTETVAEEKPEVKTTSDDTTGASLGEEKKVIPNDIFDDKIPEKEVLPLDDAVETKSYATISEPAPSGGESKSSSSSSSDSESSSGASDAGGGGAGPSTTEAKTALTPEEVQSQAAQTVSALIKIYEKVHGIGRWAAKKDPASLLQMHTSGKIDLNQELPLGSRVIQVKDFFNQFNAGIDEAIVVDQDFKDNITPPLTRIAIKRGWLLGDELYVGMLLAEDLGTKVSLLVGLAKSANLVLEACIQMQAEVRKAREERRNPPGPNPDTAEPITEHEEWKEPEANL